MGKYVISPMTEVPYMYEDDKYYKKYAGTDVEVIREVDLADELAFMHENMELDTPHPPLSLLDENPLEYIMEFMFLQRQNRLRECDWEFWCLHWQPVTFRILEICTEYCSQKNVDLMNETAELERAHKNLGPRRTTVLTPEVYEAQTIARTRNPPKGEKPWNRDDHIWCICEAVKLFPKNLAKNIRFKERLGLPIPGEDYEVIRGNVRNELETLRSRPAATNVVVKQKKATPASKVGGVRRKAARTKTNNRNAPISDDDDDYNDTVAKLAASRRSPFIQKSDVAAVIASSSANKRNTAKRAIQERSSDEEFIPGNFASPKKKIKAMNATTNKKNAGKPKPAAADSSPTTPARGRTKARFTAAEESKAPKGRGVTVKGEDDVIRTLDSHIYFQDPATFAPDSDSDVTMSSGDDDDADLSSLFEDDVEMLDLSGLSIQYDYESGYESDESAMTITQDRYVRRANNVNGGL